MEEYNFNLLIKFSVNYVHFMTIMNGNRIMYISPDFFIMPDYERYVSKLYFFPFLKSNISIISLMLIRSYYCFDGLPIQNGIVEEILQRKLGQQKGWVSKIKTLIFVVKLQKLEIHTPYKWNVVNWNLYKRGTAITNNENMSQVLKIVYP